MNTENKAYEQIKRAYDIRSNLVELEVHALGEDEARYVSLDAPAVMTLEDVTAAVRAVHAYPYVHWERAHSVLCVCLVLWLHRHTSNCTRMTMVTALRCSKCSEHKIYKACALTFLVCFVPHRGHGATTGVGALAPLRAWQPPPHGHVQWPRKADAA